MKIIKEWWENEDGIDVYKVTAETGLPHPFATITMGFGNNKEPDKPARHMVELYIQSEINIKKNEIKNQDKKI